MSIPVKDFIAQVKAIAAEEPKYRLGGYGKDGTCDCIGLTIGAIRRAGGTWGGTHGSNYAARYQTAALERNTAENLFVGKQVYKAREKGHARWKLPSRYAGHADQRDYYHAGVVTGVTPLEITHSTGTGLPSSIRRDTALGAWDWGGKLRKVGYDDAVAGDIGDVVKPVDGVEPTPAIKAAAEGLTKGKPRDEHTGAAGSVDPKPATLPSGARAATVSTKNGKPLHIRAQPTKACGLYWDAPNGTTLQVLETNTGAPNWWKVRFGGFVGYCKTDFLSVG